jgi:predicted dehydrogenase
VGEILLFDYDFVLQDPGESKSKWYWDGTAGGGCWYGLGWHACFLIAWYLGLPDQIRVQMIRSNRRNWPYQTDDTTVFECSYKDGPLVRGFTSVVGVEKREQLFIQGTKGTIQVDRAGAVLFDAKGTVVKKLDNTAMNPYVKQLEGIASAINERSHPYHDPVNTYVVDDRLTAKTMLMISKGIESAQNAGQSVQIQNIEML